MLPGSLHGGTRSLSAPSLVLLASCCLPVHSFWLHFCALRGQPNFGTLFVVYLTCWIELPLQRELDFHHLQGLQVGFLFGHVLCPCQLPFRLWGPIWLFHGFALRPLYSSLDALLRPLEIIAVPWVTFGFACARFTAFRIHFWGSSLELVFAVHVVPLRSLCRLAPFHSLCMISGCLIYLQGFHFQSKSA